MSCWTRTRRGVVVALGACALTLPLLLGAAAAHADDAADETGDATEDAGRLMLVLDSSGSMAEPAGGGQTKIEAAKTALHEVIGGLDDGQQVGLRVYGATVFARSDKGACTDSQQVVAPGTDNRDELDAAVDGYKPYGETPIGYALQQAGDDLGSEGHRTIVLVSDGEATCPPAPCEVARELAAQGIDLTIDVVGLDVSGSARRQLQCVAAAGNGTYYDADDADQLATSIDQSATRAARPFGFQGTPVEGTAELGDDTPTIGVGSWVDSLGGSRTPTSTRTYVLERTVPGSTLHVSASILGDGGDDDAITVEANAPSLAGLGAQCDEQVAFRLGDWTSLLSTGVLVGPHTNYDQPGPCRKGDEVVISVRRAFTDGSRSGDYTVPLAVYVIEEPPVEGVGELPDQADEAELTRVPAVRDGEPVVAGASFDDAPTLEPGAYTSDIVNGETQVYLVDVDWGERLQANVSWPQLPDNAVREGNVHLSLYGPTRREAGIIFNQDQTLLGTFADRMAATTYPVRYLNRQGVNDQPGASLPGTYAVAVSVVPDEDQSHAPMEYGLQIGVYGEPGGEPRYIGDTPTPGTEEPTDDPTDGPTDTDDTTPTSASSDGLHPVVPIGLGTVGAAAIAGAVLLTLRRRRS